MQIAPMPTAEILRTASVIAARFEGKGQAISPTEAIEQAQTAIAITAQLEALNPLPEFL